MSSRVLIVGGGAREHALAWKIAQSPRCGAVLVAPGNAGTAAAFQNIPTPTTDVGGIVQVALRERADLVIVGPEDPLALGLADRLSAHDIPVFGPGADGARIESSKAWAKTLLAEAGVPTAQGHPVRDLETARRVLAEMPAPVVVKADGLAAGKGVTVCETRADAEGAVRQAFSGAFGVAGETVLIEEFLTGDEVSIHALVEGETVVPLLPARDHKRIGDGDTGANTGGMGAYAPTSLVDHAALNQITETILQPTVRALTERGISYRGVLYAGLILTEAGPMVIEYNCRFGDPETQVMLPLLDTDFLTLCEATARGTLASVDSLQWRSGACAGVVIASGGYPGTYRTGLPITGLDRVEPDTLVFHAGTREGDNGDIVTSGGRVLTVAAVAPTLGEARGRAYRNAERIEFAGAYYRRDIAARELSAR